MRRKSAAVLAVILAVATVCRTPAGTLRAQAASGQDNREGTYVVMVSGTQNNEEIREDYADSITGETEVSAKRSLYTMELTRSEAFGVQEETGIKTVEQDIILSGSSGQVPEVVSVKPEDQWNIDAVGANEKEYRQVPGSEEIRVAVMDSGITLSNDIPVVERVNFIEGEDSLEPLYDDISGHGTSVASVIAAQDNGEGITGVNPDARLYSVKVLDEEKHAPLSRVVAGIYWCIDHDIDIINMSFGTAQPSGLLEQAVGDAEKAGILMIAAAGNGGMDEENSTVEYPAAYPEVMAVGSVGADGVRSEFSASGNGLELMAPGERIPVTGFFDEVVAEEGTSVAAPHITGLASILWARDPEKPADFIRVLLNASARKAGEQTAYGNGLADLDYALSLYEEFEKTYERNDLTGLAEIPSNGKDIPDYSDQEVEANWYVSQHEAAVSNYGSLSRTEIAVIKRGVKYCDDASYLRFSRSKGMEYTKVFHGHGKYVGNYVYLMRMARACASGGIDKALAVKYPGTGGNNQDYVKKGVKKINNNWNSLLGGYDKTNRNKACFLVGVAVHVAMDTYAHKAYVKKKKGDKKIWVAIDGTSYKNEQDDTKFKPARWQCAKNIAYNILYLWHHKYEPSAQEFYQVAHNKGQFWLLELKTYVKETTKSVYKEHADWIEDRSAVDVDANAK